MGRKTPAIASTTNACPASKKNTLTVFSTVCDAKYTLWAETGNEAQAALRMKTERPNLLLAEAGVDKWEAAGFPGMSVEMLVAQRSDDDLTMLAEHRAFDVDVPPRRSWIK